MNKHLVIFLSSITLGFVLIVGWKYTKPLLDEQLQKKSSDASATLATLHIGMDNWIGYFPLCSPGMQKNLRLAGYQLRCEDDQADYATRFRRLRRGELQFAAATVDSYLLNGRREDYPGTIIMVLDESKGGDALVAKRSVFSSLDDLKGESLQKKGGKQIAFTANAPSEHLLKGISRDFGLPFFTPQDSGHWMVKTDGSEKALQKLRKGEVAAAVLWEPDVSRALALPDMVKLIGTEDTDRLIVDVLLVERSYSVNQPEAVRALVQAYFTTLEEYRHDPKSLLRDIKHASGLDDAQIQNMLEGVAWADLADNHTLWFSAGQGIGSAEGIVDAIHLALKIFHYSGDVQGNPLPGGDPYRITNRSFIEALAQDQAVQASRSTGSGFRALNSGQWDKLKKVGTLKVDPIPFRPSTNELDETGRGILDDIAATLHRYPRYRILVEGHTGLGGDPEANRRLSEERAQAVANHLIQQANFDPNRIRALGFGASQPLPRLPNEADRAYSYRLSRVDISLLSE